MSEEAEWPVLESMRAHLCDRHRRDRAGLPDDPSTWEDLHRFEHFEAAAGLLRLDHTHGHRH